MQLQPKDITIVSPVRINDDALGRLRLSLFKEQVNTFNSVSKHFDGIKMIVVDYSSTIPIDREITSIPPGMTVLRYEDEGPYRPGKAANIALPHVQTKVFAKTNADVLFSKLMIEKSLRAHEISGGNDHFIMQGYRWEIPRYLTEIIIDGSDVSEELLRNLSVPVSVPRLPSSEWQLTVTQDLIEIGGFDEEMGGYASEDVDMHDRMLLYLTYKYGRGDYEILCRSIPVLHAFHFANRPYSDSHKMRLNKILKFVGDANVEGLICR